MGVITKDGNGNVLVFGKDIDNLLSYETLKIVRIRDWRLGAIHHGLQLGILIYIIVVTIIVQQRYLRKEIPFGDVRITAREPSTYSDLSSLPYCKQSQPTINSFNNLDCIYYNALDAVYPAAESDAIYITTRLKTTTYQAPPANCFPPTTVSCMPNKQPTAANTTSYYVADVQNFTIFIEHVVYGQLNDILENSQDMKGTLVYSDGTKVKLAADRTGDIFTIQQFLDAADQPDLDVPSEVINGKTLRYDGAFFMVIVEYENRASQVNAIKYRYHVRSIPGVDNVVFQPPIVDQNGNRVELNRHGIKFLFIQSGSIGQFDFPTLLISLVSAVVLLRVATTIVDVVALNVMPQRTDYRNHKYELTEDFSEKRKSVRAESQSQL